MTNDEALKYITEEWVKNPLTAMMDSAVSTTEGIKQQIDNGNLSVLYMVMEDGDKVIKRISLKP